MSHGVELIGVGLNNRGAELMLRAVDQRIRDRGLTLILGGRAVDRSGLSEVNARRMARPDPERHPYLWRPALAVSRTVPAPWWHALGLLAPDRSVALMDASGYAYGDPWGTVRSRRREPLFRWYRSNGRPVVMLPQAFGPFTDSAGRVEAVRLLRHATLVFARDTVSRDHLFDLLGEEERVRLAPDFTCEVEGVPPNGSQRWRGRACVVPNGKMISEVARDIADRYVPFMSEVVGLLTDAGMAPFILQHEDDQDATVCRAIAAATRVPVPVVSGLGAIAAKGVIGSSALVVGSRYHALVSSLSQGVPALGTSWSHKYRTLFEDFRIEHALISDLDPGRAAEYLAPFLDGDRREAMAEALRSRAGALNAQVKAMWDEVLSLVAEPDLPVVAGGDDGARRSSPEGF